MAYSELIKNFERIREYMRQFYVFGFQSRNDFDQKSLRSYDNERRRIESWLGDFMVFRQTAEGKHVFLSMDSRSIPSNPLYNAFQAKSFTDGDITFHFLVLDLLAEGETYSLKQILDLCLERCHYLFDESNLRKKLKEYVELGLICQEKQGRENRYRLAGSTVDLRAWEDALCFFSEIDCLGPVGASICQKTNALNRYFRFKHHYLLGALDSEVLYQLLSAIGEQRNVTLTIENPRRKHPASLYRVCPLRILRSTQSGRCYLFAYYERRKQPMIFRTDHIHGVNVEEKEPQFPKFNGFYEKYQRNQWGVSMGEEFSLDHIEMQIHVEDNEGYIYERLMREKRCGTVQQIDGHTLRFSADVYDASEMLPWVRTFIGRIQELRCSNAHVVKTFYADLAEMRAIYGGESHAVP